jgi:hypothetical protein
VPAGSSPARFAEEEVGINFPFLDSERLKRRLGRDPIPFNEP